MKYKITASASNKVTKNANTILGLKRHLNKLNPNASCSIETSEGELLSKGSVSHVISDVNDAEFNGRFETRYTIYTIK